MERLEAHEKALADVSAAHESLVGQRTVVEGERDAALASIDAESARVAAERVAAADGIDPGLLATYDRLRGQLGGVGAALLRGNRCEGCRLELNPLDLDTARSAPPDQVVRCEECGRILVRQPAS
jgi:predicted  nucleic acid-binding Zn-ribbon protein